MNILQIKSSLFGDDGQSSRLANEFAAALLERNPGAELVVRDVVKTSGNDWQAQFVRVILGFVGITDVAFVFAEGLAISEARKQASIAQARSALRKLVPETRLAA
jgi:FMN-dependent NADH-azoreductase